MNKRTWGIIAFFVIIILLVVTIGIGFKGGFGYRGFRSMGPGMMHGYGFRFGGFNSMFLMWLFPVLFVVLVVFALFKFAGSLSRDNSREDIQLFKQGTQRSPKEYVKMRYAKGELSRDEYQQILDDLSEDE